MAKINHRTMDLFASILFLVIMSGITLSCNQNDNLKSYTYSTYSNNILEDQQFNKFFYEQYNLFIKKNNNIHGIKKVNLLKIKHENNIKKYLIIFVCD